MVFWIVVAAVLVSLLALAWLLSGRNLRSGAGDASLEADRAHRDVVRGTHFGQGGGAGSNLTF